MTDISKVLQRKAAMEANMDPMGTVWGIFHVGGTAMYEVAAVLETEKGAVPDRRRGKPKEVDGMFTDATKAEPQVKKLLKRLWDESDAAAIKLDRKRHKEQVEEQNATSTG